MKYSLKFKPENDYVLVCVVREDGRTDIINKATSKEQIDRLVKYQALLFERGWHDLTKSLSKKQSTDLVKKAESEYSDFIFDDWINANTTTADSTESDWPND